jgi:broad specificity phosphatase PhoE
MEMEKGSDVGCSERNGTMNSSGHSSGTNGVTLPVYFIRHAESAENARLAMVGGWLKDLNALRLMRVVRSLPAAVSSLGAVGSTVFAPNRESPLTGLGARQLSELKQLLQDNQFWALTNKHTVHGSGAGGDVDLVLCSPFYRARITCEKICPHILESSAEALHSDNGSDSVKTGSEGESMQRVEYVDCLAENSTLDEVFTQSSDEKLRRFEYLLGKLLVESKDHSKYRRVIVVGHCQFFRRLLAQSYYMRNCDVVSAQLSIEATDGPRPYVCSWRDVKLEHRCFLAAPHPFSDSHPGEGRNDDNARAAYDGSRTGGIDGDIAYVDTDAAAADENQISCRFCLMTAQENPASPLIRPCLCTGE